MSKTEIRIAGFGGQGVILAGMIIGKAAALHSGKHATMIQAFGPESRGSSCSAQLTIADEPVKYPYIQRTDILVALNQDAYNRFEPELKDGGLLLHEEDLVTPHPEQRSGIRIASVPATRFAEELQRAIVLNIVMVGFFTSVTGLVTPDAMRAAVKDSVPAGTEKLNLQALERGLEHGLAVAKA